MCGLGAFYVKYMCADRQNGALERLKGVESGRISGYLDALPHNLIMAPTLIAFSI
jgi:hypothetical protein